MTQEISILEEIRGAVTETNRLLRVAFAEQLKAALEAAATKAFAGKDDQVAVQILHGLLLRPQKAEELITQIGGQYGISRRTIYRRLEKLVEAGLLKANRQEGSVLYVLQLEALT